MLRAFFIVSSLVALVTLQGACTVVTSCPTTQPAPAAGGSGNAPGGGGSSGAAPSGDIGTTGLPLADWTNATSNLAAMKSECGNLGTVAAKPDEDLLFAGVAQLGLWSSADGGGSWKQVLTKANLEPMTNRPTAVVFDPDHSEVFWECGIYNGTGVFRSTDGGKSIVPLTGVKHTDLVAIDFNDPDRHTLLAGGHEQSRTLNLSVDGGQNWMPTGDGLPDATNCTLPYVVDSSTFLVSCGGYGGGPTGIYRSTDAGVTWDAKTDVGGSSRPLRASDGSIYWTTQAAFMLHSTDGGETWTQVTAKGLPGYVAPVELPDTRLATTAADGSGVIVSADQGTTWQRATSSLPFKDIQGLTYSAQQKAFYIWHFSCESPVPDDAIMRAEFDYEATPN